MASADMWSYSAGTRDSMDIAGFTVEARDGSIGTVDTATYDTAAGWIVVDTGPWILRKKVTLPAGTIERIDYGQGRVYVERYRDEIKNAPEFDEAAGGSSRLP